MKIAFLHYHLKTGGVTTVIRQQAEALAGRCDRLVLAGKVPKRDYPFPVVEIPGLDYHSDDRLPEDPEKTAGAVMDAIRSRWKDGCDVLHVHNATLAKNKTLLTVLKMLQKRGVKLLIQTHDFAEDGRPLAYSDREYPRDCHYAAINSRDRGFLLDAGLKPEGLHLVPNMVDAPPALPPVPLSNFVLYPVRAIRRKNIGEALLLSLFFRDGEELAVTRPPNSPADQPSYQGWKDFVREQGLSVHFEAGMGQDFDRLMSSARYILNTSVTEGFGFCFMEAWLFGKWLWGRLLPDICSDFMEKGVRLNHLYSSLSVPVDWIGKDAFVEKWTEAFEAACRNFQIDLKPAAPFRTARDGALCVDFGLLNERFQKKALLRLIEGKEGKRVLAGLNPFLDDPGRRAESKETIERNKRAILEHYNRDAYRSRLLEVYRRVRERPVRQGIDKKALLKRFLIPETFSLLKWAEYDGTYPD